MAGGLFCNMGTAPAITVGGVKAPDGSESDAAAEAVSPRNTKKGSKVSAWFEIVALERIMSDWQRDRWRV